MSHQATNKSKLKLQLHEIIFITVLSTALGITWWGYSLIYDIIAPGLKVFGLQNLLDGPWYMGGIFFAYIIRKPGSALLGELLAATVEGMISQWGLSAIISGFFQGIPVEMLFLLCRYRTWNTPNLMFAGSLSALGGYLVTFYYEQQWLLSTKLQLLNCGCDLISGALIAGLGAQFLANKLASSGALSPYLITKSKPTT